LTLFGDIKIDKLRLLYKKGDVSYEDRLKVHNRLKKYYPDGTTSSKMGFIQQTFTPTKLFDKNNPEIKHNLQMPSQDVFLDVLNSLTLKKPALQEQINSTLIHLTKDLILTKPVEEYISFLANRTYSFLEVDLKYSNDTPSLYLHYNLDPESDESCKFIIKFYDKVKEYYKRHGHYHCKLHEPLRPDEIALVGDAYDKENNILDLEYLNILRIESEYHESAKISPITKALDPDSDRLTVPLMLESMRAGIFYDTLDKVFLSTLKKHVFNASKTHEEATADLSKIRGLACNLLLESPQVLHHKAVAKELGMSNQFSELETVVRKIIPDSMLYTELYNTLFYSTPDVEESEEVEEKMSVRTCKPYSLRQFKHFILIYEVYIWDDS